MSRPDGRSPGQLRPLELRLDSAPYAEGSCLISAGQTRVLCTVSVEEGVPGWRERSGSGWVTAEYGMLPRSTHTRSRRERGSVGGRTQEIQRLIGRSLRSVIDLSALGERTVTLACDVLQADGGTRTASISGAYVALSIAMQKLLDEKTIKKIPLHGQVAAVSVGIYDGAAVLDLDYPEDSQAETDMNIVMNEAGRFIEVQGTAEGHAFSDEEFGAMLALARKGIAEIIVVQNEVLSR